MRFTEFTHPDRTLRVGIVGLGMGHGHLGSMLAVGGYEIVALCDLDSERIDRAQATLVGARRPPASAFEDYDELLRSGECDALCLALPIPLNAQFARRALETGHHVLSEKPLATNLVDAARLARAVEASGRAYQIGFEMRHSPLMQTVLQTIERGDIGRPAAINYTYFRRANHSGRPWAFDGEGGSILFDCLSHTFDLFGMFAGEPMASVAALCSKQCDAIDDDPDVGAIAMRFESGVHGTLLFCEFCAQPHYSHMTIAGDDGKIMILPSNAGEFTMYWGKGQHETRVTINPESTTRGHLGMHEQHIEFKNAVDEGRAPYAGFEAGLRSLLLSVGASHAVAEGRVVGREELMAEFDAGRKEA